MREIIIKVVLSCAAAFASMAAQAQTVYVIDYLAVGVHENNNLNSTIVQVLPTGATLEVLEYEDELVKVRTNEGLEGWIDKNYVMEDKPSQLALLELEAQHVDSINALEVARAEIEALTLTVDALQSVDLRQETTEEATSDALREMQRLAEENQSLKQELESAKAIAATAQTIQEVVVTPTGEPYFELSSRPRPGLSLWHWIMVFALMVLAFGFGGYVVDWSVRRRHGGFRV